MKVLMLNGSPHEHGCTYVALSETAKALNEQGIETEIVWIGKEALEGGGEKQGGGWWGEGEGEREKRS